MICRKAHASRWRASALKIADELVIDLSIMHRHAGARGDPGLVDLACTLKRAQRLRRILCKSPQNTVFWEKAFQAVAFSAAVMRKIHSLLNNCTHFLEVSFVSLASV